MRVIGVFAAMMLVASSATRANEAITADSLRAYMQARRYGELIRVARASLADAAPKTRTDSLAAADLSELLAEACWRERANRPSDAESLAADAVARRERLHGPKSPEVARVLPHLARVRRFAGDRAGALSAFQRSVAILEGLPGHERELATTLVGLGNLQKDLDDLAASRRSHERAVSIRTRLFGPDHHETAVALVNLGNTLRLQGETAAALLADSHALKTFEAESPLDTVIVLTVIPNVINSFFTLSQESEALPLCERYLDLARRALRPGAQGLVDATENLGLALAAVGRIEEARQVFGEEVGLLGAVRGSTQSDQLRSWRNLGRFEEQHGDPDSALARLERARAGYDRLAMTSPDARFGLMTLQLDLGQFALDHGQDSLACQRFTEALQTGVARRLAQDHPDMVAAHHGLARSLFHRGDLARAFDEECAAAVAQGEDERRQYEVLTEDEAMGYRASKVEIDPSLVSLVLASPSAERRFRAYDALVHSHALVLDAMAFRRRLLADRGDSTARQLSHELAGLVREQARARLQAPFREPTESERQRRVDLERRLAEKSRALRGDLARRDVGLAEVGQRLRDGEALIHYMRLSLHVGWTVRRRAGATIVEDSTRAAWVAWIERRGEVGPDLVLLGQARSLDPLLEGWIDVLEDDARPHPQIADSERRRRGVALRRAIWDPLATRLAGIRHVLMVPDGQIYRTPLVTLPSRSGSPLLETGPQIELLSSPRDLVSFEAVAAARGDWLAFADPDFDTEPGSPRARTQYRAISACDRGLQSRFPRLPGTLDEARSLAEVAGTHGVRVRILSGAAATVENFETLSEAAGGLHVATHGYAIADTCEPASRPMDPMLRFGFLLAGANHSRDGAGWMSAAELATLDLGASGPVIISACHSGAGEALPGEGLFGIARALTLTSARSAVLSTGPIDDEIAAYWMRRFYTHLFLEHSGTAGAARAAALDVRHRLLASGRDRPSQWGAYVSMGDPR